MDKEVFFSVIIPTYNPKKFLPKLLKSISHNECIDKMEIIISDDCSTESFDDVIEKFEKLNIRKITNDKHYGFPRCGRQHGSEEAKGVWFTFADQDDYYLDNAFDKILAFIKETDAKNYIITDFIEESVETGKRIIRKRAKGWTHGKFYEREFWDKYNVSYDDVEYCEDINLSVKLDCIVSENNIKISEFNEPVYVWGRRRDSLADMDYFIRSMPDYITATLGVIEGYVEKYKDKTNEGLFNCFVIKFFATLLHIYFYHQSSFLCDKKQVHIKTVNVTQPILTRFEEATGFKPNDIVYLLSGDLLNLFQQTRNDDFNQIPFIEQITFKDWLELYFD